MKLMTFKNLMLLVFYLGFSNLAVGQAFVDPPISLGSIKGNSEGWPTVHEIAGCEANVKIQVFIANLDQFAPFQNPYGQFQFPTNRPPLYLRFSVNGENEITTQLTNFTYRGTVAAGQNYYEAVIPYTYNIQNDCELSEIGYTTINVNAQLVTPSKEKGYKIYPACNYTGRNDIFSCGVFVHANDDCDGGNKLKGEFTEFSIDTQTAKNTKIVSDPDNNDCSNYDLTHLFSYAHINCNNCTSLDSESLDAHKKSSKSNNIINSIQQSMISVYPNPFKNNIKIDFNQTIKNISLFDINGRLVETWDKNSLETNSIDYNSSFLPKGIYFLKVESSNALEVVKITKQ